MPFMTEHRLQQMDVKMWMIVLAVIVIKSSQGFQWTSDIQDDSLIRACTGDDVALNWTFTTIEGEEVTSVKWYYESDSSPNKIIATLVDGMFFTMHDLTQTIYFVPEAGLILSSVSVNDSGSYSVIVETSLAGFFRPHSTSAVLQVSKFMALTDGQLQVTIAPEVAHNTVSNEWSLQLYCGTFRTADHPPVEPVWTTPTGETEASTAYRNGHFILQLANPVKGGYYTCRLTNDSLDSICISNGDIISATGSVYVDEASARFFIIEARQNKLQNDNDLLTADVNRLKGEIAVLEDTIADMGGSIGANNSRYSFEARLSTDNHFSNGEVIILDNVITNEGSAYNSSTGVFTSPEGGVYFFMASSATVQHGSTANLNLKVDNYVLAELYSPPFTTSLQTTSCHTVVRLTTGQRVFLESNGEGDFHSPSTSFSGFYLEN